MTDTEVREYFIHASSFGAPFFPDVSYKYIEATSALEALRRFVESYNHPAGLCAAVAYPSADAMHKGTKPFAKWLSNHAREKQRLTEKLGAYGYYTTGPGYMEINGTAYRVVNPKQGDFVAP